MLLIKYSTLVKRLLCDIVLLHFVKSQESQKDTMHNQHRLAFLLLAVIATVNSQGKKPVELL